MSERRDTLLGFWGVVVLPFALIGAVLVFAALVLRSPPAQPRQQPLLIRCFPPGTELPYSSTTFDPAPVFGGCPDYRMNEGMEA